LPLEPSPSTGAEAGNIAERVKHSQDLEAKRPQFYRKCVLADKTTRVLDVFMYKAAAKRTRHTPRMTRRAEEGALFKLTAGTSGL
jgi:hypothetical protein